MPGYRKHFLAIPRRSGSDRAQSKQPIKARDFFLQEAEILTASLVYLGVNSVIQAMLWFWLVPGNAAVYFGVSTLCNEMKAES